MNVLFSIKPIYVKGIELGTKHFEFRRKIFKKEVDNVIVYSSSPIQLVSGYFKYKGYLSGTPEEIWSDCKEHAGISKNDFFKYFKGRQEAYAIIIKDFVSIDSKYRPQDVIKGFVPPQSFRYIEDLDDFISKIEDVIPLKK